MMNGTNDAMSTIMYLNRLTMLTTRYLGTSFYGLGLIGVLINAYVLLQSAFRLNSCCLFLLALNTVDFLYIHNGLLVRIVQHGFHWDPLVIFPFVCQMRYYFAYVLVTLYVILMTLASFERYASTCKQRNYWRRFNKPATVYYTLLGSTLICCVVCLFTLSCYSVNQNSVCTARNGACRTFTIVYTFIAVGVVPPVFTGFFAYLTLRNLRILHHRARAAPVSYKTFMRIKDANEQLTSILFTQVAAMSVSSLPYASFMVYLIFTRHMDKMPLHIAWEQLISNFVHLLTYINYVCSAYVYLATSPIYRKQLMSRHKLFPTRFGVGDEFHTSMLVSMSLAEHAGALKLLDKNNNII